MARNKPRLSQEEFLKHADNVFIGDCVEDVVDLLERTIKSITQFTGDTRVRKCLPDHERANLSDVVLRLRAELSYVRDRKNKRIDAQTKRSKRILAADKKNR
jgi:hypothetical protein